MNEYKKNYIELKPKQKEAISELTNLESKSYKDIAKTIGISISTLNRWRKKPEFSSALEESFDELKENVESEAETSTYIRSLRSIVKYYTNIDKLQYDISAILLLIADTFPILIEKQNKFVTKDNELNTKLTNLKKRLIEMELDLKEMRKEIEALALSLE